MTREKWVKVEEAAKQVGKSVDTLRRWRREGRISVVSGHVAIDQVVEVEKAMRERNPNEYASPVVALARDLGVDANELRAALAAVIDTAS